MTKRYLLTAVFSLALCIAPCVWADNSTTPTKGVDAEIRENPDLGAIDSLRADSLRKADRSFIKLAANHINYNGADWSAVRRGIANTADSVFTIVHLGDSHIQAEGSTTPTRLLLQKRYGTGGRGLVIPFKLAGTNQPWDFTIASPAKFVGSRLLKKPWPTLMGFTGIAIQPESQNFDLQISAKEKDSIDTRFNHMRIHFSGSAPNIEKIVGENKRQCRFTATALTGENIIEIYIEDPDPLAEATVTFSTPNPEQVNIHGIELLNGHRGLVYSAIGNNGATYGTYNDVAGEAHGLASLHPDLLIISLGANESFGNISDSNFYNEIDRLVTDLQRECPGATLLLTTPNETHKSYTKVANTRRRGRRGAKTRKVKSYHVNADSKRLRDVILKYGEDHNIATYDWYEVAGGDGSSHPWLSTGLMRNDRIHNSWEGYSLQGRLMYDALVKAFEEDAR